MFSECPILSLQRSALRLTPKSELKTTLKKFDAAIAGGDKAEATAAYTTAVKAVDQAAAKHLLHKNNASNKKSKMTTKLNGMA